MRLTWPQEKFKGRLGGKAPDLEQEQKDLDIAIADFQDQVNVDAHKKIGRVEDGVVHGNMTLGRVEMGLTRMEDILAEMLYLQKSKATREKSMAIRQKWQTVIFNATYYFTASHPLFNARDGTGNDSFHFLLLQQERQDRSY